MNKKPFILGIIVGILLTMMIIGSVIKIVEWNNLKDKPKYVSYGLNNVNVLISQLPKQTNIDLFINTDSRTEYYEVNDLTGFEKYLGGEKTILSNKSDYKHPEYNCDTHTVEKRIVEYSGLNSEWNIILFEHSNCN